jgi:V-type H+-transporting ATPase subunit G
MDINVDRVQKLKDARAEAAKEIEAYRAQKEKDFTSFESEVCDVSACPQSLATTTLCL